MFLLDTNVISELRNRKRADRNVLAWADGIPTESFFLSAISILEIEIGALRSARKDRVKAASLRAWIDDKILPRFQHRILAVDTAVALRCAPLHVPNPRAERDALIAATAMAHGFTLVTRNLVDFASTGVALFNPWLAQAGRSGVNEAQRPYQAISQRRKRLGEPQQTVAAKNRRGGNRR
jgi:toxin FitB